jgi:cytochrome c-type biogenesis protein CcmH/NrfG
MGLTLNHSRDILIKAGVYNYDKLGIIFSGGLMKKEYQILAIFLGIIIISGAIIYAMLGSDTKTTTQPVSGAASEELQMPPASDSTKAPEQIRTLEGQLKTNPNDYEALVGLGNTYYDINNAPKAIEYYERALKIQPDNAMVMVDLGAMYRQINDPDKAIELFNKAIELNPKLSQAYFNLGMVLRMEKKDARGAAKAWLKYLELDPNSQAKEFLKEQIKLVEDSSKG